ncbi:MAG: hypothetical protein ACD_24C00482G0006, partial [uncultured bacterium]
MKAIKILINVLVFFTPLVFVTNTNELYEFPKMYFVYFMGITTFFIFCVLLLFSKIKFKSPSIPILFYLSTTIISTIFSS